MTTLISQNGGPYDTFKRRILYILQMKPHLVNGIEKLLKKTCESAFIFPPRGRNQISSEAGVYSFAVILRYRTLAGMERRDDPWTHGGSVAGAGAAVEGRPDGKNGSLKRTQNRRMRVMDE